LSEAAFGGPELQLGGPPALQGLAGHSRRGFRCWPQIRKRSERVRCSGHLLRPENACLSIGERNVMAPTPRVREREARNSISFYRQAPDGSMRIVRPEESLWDRS
jgi:hypothetical protein